MAISKVMGTFTPFYTSFYPFFAPKKGQILEYGKNRSVTNFLILNPISEESFRLLFPFLDKLSMFGHIYPILYPILPLFCPKKGQIFEYGKKRSVTNFLMLNPISEEIFRLSFPFLEKLSIF